jgi:hypothetical protein
MTSIEIWKDIPEYEGRYLVSNTGKVKSLKIKNGFGVHSKDKEIKLEETWNGYLRASLSKKKMLVHRIVAKTFLPNLNNLPDVNHKDGNKKNNCVENLEWISKSNNTKHAYSLGLLKKMYGENNPQSKLTNIERAEIVSKLETDSVKNIANKFKISESVISKLRKNLGFKDARIKLSKLDKEKIILEVSKNTYLQLAKKYGVSKSLIAFVVKTHKAENLL